MNFQTILAMIAASTPDGRWGMLQAYLRKHPNSKWAKSIKRWANQTPDEAMAELELWAIEEYGIGATALVNGSMREKIRAGIENLQARYRERASMDNGNQPEKEIKNVRTNRQIERRRSEKRPRAKRHAKAKRTAS